MAVDVVQRALQILEDTRPTPKPVRLVRPQRLQLPLMYLGVRTVPGRALRGQVRKCCPASQPTWEPRHTIRQHLQQHLQQVQLRLGHWEELLHAHRVDETSRSTAPSSSPSSRKRSLSTTDDKAGRCGESGL